MAKLEVEIGAKTQKLQKGLKDAKEALKKFEDKSKQLNSQLRKNAIVTSKVDSALENLNRDYKEGAIDLDKYTNGVKILEGRQNALAKNANKLSTDLSRTNKSIRSLANQSMPQLGKSTANAVPAVTELSRVIQDAPFGIQGVGNNIQQLTAVFGNLVTKTGGTTSALKAMLGALSGPAGILFAVSVVTSALTAFGTSLFSASKKSDKLKDSTKGTNEELKSQGEILKNLIKEYDHFGKIRTKSIFNITKEKESVKALFSILTDELSTVEEKQRAYSELEKTYSNYLKGVDPNNISQVLKAEKALTKQLEVREKKIQTLIRLEETARNIQLKRVEIENLLGDPKNQKKINALGDEILKLRDLQKELRTALSLYTALDTSLGKYGTRTRPRVQSLNLTRIGINANGGDVGASVSSGEVQPEAPILDSTLQNFDEFSILMQLKLQEFAKNADQIIQSEIVNAFVGIGEAIGNALSGAADLGDSLAKVLLSSIGSLLKKLGTLAISFGVTIKGIGQALISLNPAVAIAAGTAAIALGTVFSNASQRLGSNIGGGVGGGGVGGGSSSGGRSFGGGQFLGSQPFGGNLTFTIRGTDLVAVLNNTIDQTAIFGGNVTVSNG